MTAYELAEILLENPEFEIEVSLDVSTNDQDSGNRIFGEVYTVNSVANGKITLCAIEQERNF